MKDKPIVMLPLNAWEIGQLMSFFETVPLLMFSPQPEFISICNDMRKKVENAVKEQQPVLFGLMQEREII